MPSSALAMSGQPTSDELLEMEDWEVAPGRIREEGADHVNSKLERTSLTTVIYLPLLTAKLQTLRSPNHTSKTTRVSR